jgi:hypothetical protein
MIVAIKIMVIKNGLLATQILVTQYVGNPNFGDTICWQPKFWQWKNLWRLKKMVTKTSD